MNRWAVIALLGCGLAVYGYVAYSGQQAKSKTLNRGPISVAAIRGNDGVEAPSGGSAGNAVVDYTNALQDDVALAKKRTEEYNAATRARAEQVRKSAGESEPQ